MTTIFEVLHRRAEPYKLTLTRGQKGSYGWEITVSAVTAADAIAQLKAADAELRAAYAAQGDGQ